MPRKAAATAAIPPDPKKDVNDKVVPAPQAEKPRRTKKIGGVTYVLVNGGWRHRPQSED